MNAVGILRYGQQTVLQTLEGFPESAVETPGACGVWSVKDIIAHLASYEEVLDEFNDAHAQVMSIAAQRSNHVIGRTDSNDCRGRRALVEISVLLLRNLRTFPRWQTRLFQAYCW